MLSATEFRLLSLETDRDKLLCDMYTGDGKDNPSMTVRMATLEQWAFDVKQSAASAAEDSKQTRRMVRNAILGFAATVVAGFVLAFTVPAIKHLLGH